MNSRDVTFLDFEMIRLEKFKWFFIWNNNIFNAGMFGAGIDIRFSFCHFFESWYQIDNTGKTLVDYVQFDFFYMK